MEKEVKHKLRMQRNTAILTAGCIILTGLLFPAQAKAGIIEDLLSDDSAIRQKALYKLDSSDAKEKEKIIEYLVGAAGNGAASRINAAQDLKAIGLSAISPAMNVLKDYSLAEEQPLAGLCVSVGNPAIPELRAFLGSDRNRSLAAAALILMIDPEASGVTGFLSGALGNSGDEKLSIFCLRNLSHAVNPTDADIKTITGLVESGGSLRPPSLNCLDKFGVKAASAAPVVLKALKEETKDGKVLALKVLGSLAEASYEAVPYICELAAQGDLVMRLNALRVLGQIGVDPARVLPVLEAALKDEDEFVRAAAGEAAGLFDKKAARSVPALSAALMVSKNNYAQDKLIQALRRIGTDEALAAVEKFRKEVRHKKY